MINEKEAIFELAEKDLNEIERITKLITDDEMRKRVHCQTDKMRQLWYFLAYKAFDKCDLIKISVDEYFKMSANKQKMYFMGWYFFNFMFDDFFKNLKEWCKTNDTELKYVEALCGN